MIAALTIVGSLMAVELPDGELNRRMWDKMEWIAANSTLPLPPDVPAVVAMSEEELNRYLLGDRYVPGLNMGIEGIYNEGIFFYRDDIDLDDPEYGYLITHELVHHMQAWGEILGTHAYACVGEKEAEAYELHETWAEAHDAFAPEGDPLARHLKTRCLPPGY